MDSEATPFETAVGWLSALATGNLAIGLCVIAIALIGLLMPSGRLSVRSRTRVVLGYFALLGALVIAAALMEFAGKSSTIPSPSTPDEPDQARTPRTKSIYDPYAEHR